MNGKDILVGFGEIEEAYISEAEQFRPSPMDWAGRLLASAVAVFCVLFTGLLGCIVVIMFSIFTPRGGTDPGEYQYGTFFEGTQGVSGFSAMEDLEKKSFRAQYFQTDGAVLQEREVVVISSVQELDAFCERNREALCLNDDNSFRQIINDYDEQFFTKRLLVIVGSRDSDDLISRTVHGIYADTKGYSEGDWIIAIRTRISREAQSPKSTNHLILLELYIQDGFDARDDFVVLEYQDVEGE